MNKLNIAFVNTELDERILRSMPVEDISEDLEKAMNKQGMVQKEVQVKGKNGTFTRKQWVRAGEEQKSDKTTQAKSDDIKDGGEDLAAKQKAVHLMNNCDIGDTLGKGDYEVSVGRKKNPNNGDWEMTYTLKSTGKDLSYTEAVKVLTQSFRTPNSNDKSYSGNKPDGSKYYEVIIGGIERTVANVMWNNTRKVYQYNQVGDNGTVGKMEHTMTEKEWNTAKEVQKPANQSGGVQTSGNGTQKSDSTNLKSNREVLTEKLKDKYGSKVTLNTIERSPKSDKGNNIAFLVRGYYKNLKGEVQHFYERMYIDSDSIPKSDNVSDPNMGKTLNVGTKKATVKSYDKLSIAEKREGADTIVSIGGKRYDYYSNMMANGIGSLVPHQDDPKIDMSAAQFKPGDKGMITIRSETIPVKVVDRATLNHKLMYLVQEDRPLAHGTPKKMYWTSDYNIKPIGGNKPDKSTNNSQKIQDNLNTDSNRAKAENYLNHHLGSGETGVKVTSLETTKDGKIKVNYDVDVEISVGTDSETGQTQYESDTESRSETYDSSDLGISSDTSKDTGKTNKSDKKDIKNSSGKSVGTVETIRDKSGRTMVIATKPDGTKKEFVNTANAKDKAERYLLNESNKTKSAQQPSAGQKLSPADAKKKTQEITKGVSDKKSFMEKAKAQGITWKENDHEGINWMRCCMAMNKHFENGGTFDNSAKSKEEKPAEEKNKVSTNKSKPIKYGSIKKNLSSSLDKMKNGDSISVDISYTKQVDGTTPKNFTITKNNSGFKVECDSSEESINFLMNIYTKNGITQNPNHVLNLIYTSMKAGNRAHKGYSAGSISELDAVRATITSH